MLALMAEGRSNAGIAGQIFVSEGTVEKHVHLWKSVEWVHGITLTQHDQPGSCERRGLHNYGDPFSADSPRRSVVGRKIAR